MLCGARPARAASAPYSGVGRPLDRWQFLPQSGLRGWSRAKRRGWKPRVQRWEAAHVSRPAGAPAPRSAGDRHGAVGRDRHLPAARRAQQPARPSPARRRVETRRPLCRLPGEPSALRRVRRGGRAGRPLLHQCQFVPDRGRARLYRQQQPVEGADHVRGEARDGARGDGRMPERRALPDRRRAGPRRADQEP